MGACRSLETESLVCILNVTEKADHGCWHCSLAERPQAFHATPPLGVSTGARILGQLFAG